MEQQNSKFETLSLVFGIVAVVTGCFFLGGVFGIAGIIFFVISCKENGTTTKNIIGLVTSIIGIFLTIIMIIVAIISPSAGYAIESTTGTGSMENTTETITEVSYDELQKLFLSINENMNYQEALESVISTGLPYTEQKYNGSRQIQVAFTDNSTAQSYASIDGDYLKIIYDYPKDENSANDELEKYSLGSLAYCPYNCDLELISIYSGYYFSYDKRGNYISKLGTDIGLDSSISKEELLNYYFQNK